MNKGFMMNDSETAVYSMLATMEKIGCFEFKCSKEDQRKIAKLIIKTITEGSEDELLDNKSGRWL